MEYVYTVRELHCGIGEHANKIIPFISKTERYSVLIKILWLLKFIKSGIIHRKTYRYCFFDDVHRW